MTRTYAAKRLLEHGPLTFAEFLAITGWTKGAADNVLVRLRNWGLCQIVHVTGNHRRVYALTTTEKP